MNKKYTTWSRFLVFSIVIAITSSSALQIRDFDPVTHVRFTGGFPANPLVNTNWLGIAQDFSGVGWDDSNSGRSITLIGPKHFVGANHYRVPIGQTISFFNRFGAKKTFIVAANHSITNALGENTDLYVGELSVPVEPCDHIAWYPIANLATESSYVGQPIYVYGRTVRLGRNTISAFQDFGADPLTGGGAVHSTRVYSFAYANLAGLADDCYAEGGDSGSPSFLVIDNHLHVVGIHTAILVFPLGTDTFDTFVPHYLNQVDDVLQIDGYSAATSIDDTFRPCVEASGGGSDFTVRWGTYPGRNYQLEYSDVLPVFNTLSPPINATSGWTSYTNVNLSAIQRRYYRIVLSP